MGTGSFGVPSEPPNWAEDCVASIEGRFWFVNIVPGPKNLFKHFARFAWLSAELIVSLIFCRVPPPPPKGCPTDPKPTYAIMPQESPSEREPKTGKAPPQTDPFPPTPSPPPGSKVLPGEFPPIIARFMPEGSIQFSVSLPE